MVAGGMATTGLPLAAGSMGSPVSESLATCVPCAAAPAEHSATITTHSKVPFISSLHQE